MFERILQQERFHPDGMWLCNDAAKAQINQDRFLLSMTVEEQMETFQILEVMM
jgi:hypothetical protein